MSLCVKLIMGAIVGGIFAGVLSINGISYEKPSFYILMGLMALFAYIQVS